MARARNIKPDFFTDEDIVELNPLTRLMFIGMWTLADRQGRMEDRPKQIKLRLLPVDDHNVEHALEELQRHRFIIRYEVAGKRYIQIRNFTKHQSPHRDERDSVIPAPDADLQPPPCEHGGSTIPPPCEHGGNRPDCLNLIPDSLNPITTTTTTTRATETELQFETVFQEKEADIKRLFPDVDFEVEKAHILAHYRNAKGQIDPYERIIAWFKREKKGDPYGNSRGRDSGSAGKADAAQAGKQGGASSPTNAGEQDFAGDFPDRSDQWVTSAAGG